MKKGIYAVILCLLLVLGNCTTENKKVPTTPVDQGQGEVSLEQVLAESTEYFISRIPEGRVVAILDIETPTRICSRFIVEEIWKHFQNSGKYKMADQHNVQKIQDQLNFQNSTGLVSDLSSAGIGHFEGAQVIIYGNLTRFGNKYRLNLFSTEVEKALSNIQTKDLNPNEKRLKELLEPGDLDSRIESALTELASGLDRRTLIFIDRIGYSNSGSVTDFSKYLENQIRLNAVRLRNRYAVADEKAGREYAEKSMNASWVDDSPDRIMAMIKGNYVRLGGNSAEVTLNLISTNKNREQIGACKFTVREEELKELHLSVVPENYESQENYDEVLAKLAEFDTEHNAFGFSAIPDRPDARYRNKELLGFKIYSEKDCYFLVRGLQLDGEIVTLYPTESGENNFIKAGETRILPDRGQMRLVGPPWGQEWILISAFDEQITIPTSSGKIKKANFKDGSRVIQKQNYEEGRVNIDKFIKPVAQTKFSYTISER